MNCAFLNTFKRNDDFPLPLDPAIMKVAGHSNLIQQQQQHDVY